MGGVLDYPAPVPPQARPPSASSAELTVWMGVTDANTAGNVHGGTIMKLCDEAAALAAMRHSGGRVVTASVDRMDFRAPVAVGDLVRLRASVNAAWRTSMEVGVRVESENVRTGEVVHTSTAYLTMVALDDEETAIVLDPDAAPLDDIVEAAQNCPVDAIVITGEDGQQLYP